MQPHRKKKIMERLTSNKDVSEMGMLELAYNSCYIKDGKARCRDYDLDIDARVFTRELLKDYMEEQINRLKKMEEQTNRLKKIEREFLEQIATLTSADFAKRVAEKLDSKTHTYSFGGYLELLQKLLTLLQEGMPETTALEAVQTGLEVEKILYIWRYQHE